MAAEPVLERLRARVGALEVVRTHTSPSLRPWSTLNGPDHSDFLPLPVRGPIRRLAAGLQPDLLVSSRGELWPAMAHTARQLGIPVAIVAGSLRSSSRRLRPLARSVLRPVYRGVALAAVPTDEDARHWIRLGIDPARVHLVGDPRDDQVLHDALDPRAAQLAPWSAGRPVGVFGSLEPEEERLALDAAIRVRARYPDAVFLVVPHDPAAAAGCAARWAARGLRSEVWPAGSPVTAGPDRDSVVVAVDAVGILRSAYQFAAVAYVGGGFGAKGAHSLSEPAAFGVPCGVGPRAADGAESRRFVGHGAVALAPHLSDGQDLAVRWLSWLDDPDHGRAVGLAGRNVLREGAADRTAALLAALLARGSGVGDDGP